MKERNLGPAVRMCTDIHRKCLKFQPKKFSIKVAWIKYGTGICSLGQVGGPGIPGRKGPRGLPGRAATHYTDGFLIARHSQSIKVPDCPNGSSLIYSGYSLLFINGNERAHGQDLGMNIKIIVSINNVYFTDHSNLCFHLGHNKIFSWMFFFLNCQAQWEAASLVSPPCPSCSAIQKIPAAMLLVMTIPTGCPLISSCLPTWLPSQLIKLPPTSAGQTKVYTHIQHSIILKKY